MSGVGVKLDQFDDPVCNTFLLTILNDQLCYEVDLNKFSNRDNIEKELESGLVFLMDYNVDREVVFNQKSVKRNNESFTSKIIESGHKDHATIHLNTIGKYLHRN